MRDRLSALRALLILGVLILSGCRPIVVQPTQIVLPAPTKLPVDVPITATPAMTPTAVVEPSDVQAARDAALTYIIEHRDEQMAALGLTWTEEFTPERPFHLANYHYTANGWIVSISYRTRPALYQVVVTYQAAGFRWEGTVDATGQVTEQVAPDGVQATRDAALAHIIERYGEQVPALDIVWEEERSTPEVWDGSGVYRYTAGHWLAEVYYPMMPSEAVVCLVTVSNRATGFHWEGQVDAAGGVTELLGGVLAARDAALAYVSEHYGEQAPAQHLTWAEDYIGVPVPEGPWGAGTLQYTYTTENWAVYVSYQFLDPKPAVYEVGVNNLTTHFHWQGEVDATGQATQQFPPQ